MPIETPVIPAITGWRTRLITLATVIGLASMGAIAQPQPAEAATVVGSYVSISSATYSGGKITVKYKVLRDIPASVNISMAWKYASATRNSTSHSQISLSGKKKGSYTATLTGVPKARMIARVVVSLARPIEQISRAVLIDSGVHNTAKVVTAAEAAANAVAIHIPGAILQFVRQTKIIKVAGATVLGWSIFKDVKTAVGVPTCPTMKAGQYITTRTWLTMSGNKAVLNGTTKMWTSQANYKAGKQAACTHTSVLASWT